MADVTDDNLKPDPSSDADSDGVPKPTIVHGDKQELSALRAAVAASRGRRVNRVSWRRRARQFFTRDRLRDFGTTLALVLPLTILIWVWAEREQVQTTRRTFYVAVRTVDPSKTLTLLDDGQRNNAVDDASGERRVAVEVSMNGPRSGLDSLADQLTKDPAGVYMLLDVNDAPDVGRSYDVPLQSLIEQQKLFNDLGVSIESIVPENVRVEVDEMATRELPVRLPANLTNVVQLTHVEPATVKVRGPKRDITRLEAAGTLVAELALTPESPEIADVSRPNAPIQLADVKVRPIDAPGLTLETLAAAHVALQRSADQEETLDAMTVNVSRPAAMTGVVRIDSPTLTRVRVRGRPDAIRRLKEGRGERPYAELLLTTDDIGKSARRTPTIRGLPAGVTVVDESVEQIGFDATDGAAGTP